MPLYQYKCQNNHISQRIFPVDQRMNQIDCTTCDQVAKQTIQAVKFVLQGDGWFGKNQTIKGQMKRKNDKLDQKANEMRHDAPGMKLAPNVEGEQVESWLDAKKLASEKGLDPSSYDELIGNT